jgi:hypothetical protein
MLRESLEVTRPPATDSARSRAGQRGAGEGRRKDLQPGEDEAAVGVRNVDLNAFLLVPAG